MIGHELILDLNVAETGTKESLEGKRDGSGRNDVSQGLSRIDLHGGLKNEEQYGYVQRSAPGG